MTKIDYVQVKRAINKIYEGGESVVEVGAGYGRILALLENDDGYSFRTIEGCDVSELLISNKVCISKIHHWNILEPIETFKADIVLVWAVLMYFNNEQIKSALKNLLELGQGIIIFELPNTYYRLEQILNGLDPIYANKIMLRPIYTF